MFNKEKAFLAQQVEARDLKSLECEFESHERREEQTNGDISDKGEWSMQSGK